ncbi:MAG TPA: pantoate--beta-alanine ligase [Caulobacteraceae bacterium]|nr:pantoate--beta-alanine ligase [Caulobacteraceae bacterium]
MTDAAAPPLPVVRRVADLRAAVSAWRREGARIGLVPTMGALHEGHLSLVRLARERADRVVASVFVNPKQFAPTEDLDRYPRQEARDAELLAGVGCDLLWAPTPGEMYPDGFSASITLGGPAEGLETDFRPQMFGGVATVVAKLLNQVGPDVAVFGEKDYQQLLVIRRLVRDLDMPVEIVAGPTARDADGLALSSRNAYLSPAERAVAGRLNVVLAAAARDARAGEPVAAVEARAAGALLEAGFERVDYVAVRDAEHLGPFTPGRPGRVLAAARLGATRMIDNLAV